MLKAVRHHTDERWVLLYIERWLKAPVMMDDGSLVARDKGTPQGGVISPLLANLFLHYAFDMWIGRAMPGVAFERYADDIICHCRSEGQARALRKMVFGGGAGASTRPTPHQCGSAEVPLPGGFLRGGQSPHRAAQRVRESSRLGDLPVIGDCLEL